MQWITSNKLHIQQVLSCNSPLLISHENKNILIDTGLTKNWASLSRGIDKQICNNSLSALIITHTHHDHIQNVISIKEKYKPRIIVHRNEVDFLSDFDPYTDVLVDDRLDLNSYGINAYILHTPGHSSGSISIIIDNEIAMIGDALASIKKKPFVKKKKKVSDDTLNSWDKLIDLKCRVYICSHGNVALEHSEFIELYNNYLREVDMSLSAT